MAHAHGRLAAECHVSLHFLSPGDNSYSYLWLQVAGSGFRLCAPLCLWLVYRLQHDSWTDARIKSVTETMNGRKFYISAFHTSISQ